MIQKKTVLAVITARGGSKGLPGKNIKNIAGKPLIAWSIEEAKKSKYIDNIVVTSDNDAIIKESKKYGANVPFIRPGYLSTDKAKTIDVLKHVNEFYNNKYDLLILLQPTSPLRTFYHIDDAFEIMIKNNAKSIVSVCEMEHSIHGVGVLPENLCMKNFINKEYLNRNRQEFEKHYRVNGAIYIAEIKYLFRNNNFIGDHTYAYIMDVKDSIDIDNSFDFKIAEFLLEERSNGKF